jgi:undecaprenyl-diphosphatase
MDFLQHILEWDKELFLFLNGFHNDYWDTIMLLVTRKETWLPFYVILLFYFVKNYRIKAVLILLSLAMLITASDQLSVLLKDTIQRLRPVHEPSIEHLVHNVLRKGGLYGFVSSHAANSFAIFVFASRIFKNKSFTVLLFLWAVLVSYSRIYSGVHYPLDIIFGALLGIVLGWGLFRLMMFIENHFLFSRSPKIEKTKLPYRDSANIWFLIIVLCSTVGITSGILHYYNYL